MVKIISFSEKFHYKFISETELPGSGIIFPDPYPQHKNNRHRKVDWSLKDRRLTVRLKILIYFQLFYCQKGPN
jgi:hypothetical protein